MTHMAATFQLVSYKTFLNLMPVNGGTTKRAMSFLVPWPLTKGWGPGWRARQLHHHLVPSSNQQVLRLDSYLPTSPCPCLRKGLITHISELLGGLFLLQDSGIWANYRLKGRRNSDPGKEGHSWRKVLGKIGVGRFFCLRALPSAWTLARRGGSWVSGTSVFCVRWKEKRVLRRG